MRRRSEELDLSRYDTDKVPNGYLRFYDRVFEALVDEPVRILELGVRSGGSLELWRDYFPNSRVAGLDLDPPMGERRDGRVSVYRGRQDDTSLLSRIASEIAPDGFDIVIDDASHVAAPTRTGFWHLFDSHLKPGGLFAIEDWGTGYWERWPDGEALQEGRAHHAGMVGFVKELVDELAAHDATRGWYDEHWRRDSRFDSIDMVPSIVLVRKKGV